MPNPRRLKRSLRDVLRSLIFVIPLQAVQKLHAASQVSTVWQTRRTLSSSGPGTVKGWHPRMQRQIGHFESFAGQLLMTMKLQVVTANSVRNASAD